MRLSYRIIGTLVWMLLLDVTDGSCIDDNDCHYMRAPHCSKQTTNKVCTRNSCQTDSDCGFPLLQCSNKNCTAVVCTTHAGCDLENSVCTRGNCECKQGFRKVNETCAPVMGLKCSPYNYDIDCNSENLIYKVFKGYLNPRFFEVEYVCDTSSYSCRCNTDLYKEENGTCSTYIGTVCQSSLDCGRRSNTSCADKTCTCSPGFLLRENQCIWAMEARCNATADCIFEGLQCQGTSNERFCRCPHGYAVKSLTNTTCVKVYGSSCADIHMCGNPDDYNYRLSYFDVDYMFVGYYTNQALYCNIENKCMCAPGFRRNDKTDSCEQIYGSKCSHDANCSSHLQTNLLSYTCNSTSNTCLCSKNAESYSRSSNTICYKAVGIHCASDSDCIARENSFCNSSAMCTCKEGFTESIDQCVVEEKTCKEKVKELPDLHRRSPLYTLTFTEPPIRDDLLENTWYNIGTRMVSHVEEMKERLPGACGTYHPIYLVEMVEPSDKVQLDAGSEIIKRVQMGVLAEDSNVRNMSVQLRKCGSEYLIKLQNPAVAFAAYCIDTQVVLVSDGNSTERWAYLQQHLQFRIEYDVILSTDLYTPYVVFRCHPLDRYYNFAYTTLVPYDRYAPKNDGFLYMIHWYVDGVHCTSKGPFERQRLNESDLFENDIKQTCGKSTFGFSIRCSFQWSERIFGNKSASIFSAQIQTGIKSWTVMSSGADAFIVPSVYSTPIGCRSTKSSSKKTCLIKWEMTGFGQCPFKNESNSLNMCGMSVFGLTRQGMYNGDTEDFFSMYVYPVTFNHEVADDVTATNGFTIILDSEVTPHSGIMEARFSPLRSEHEMWDGYTIPTIKVNHIQKQNIKQTIRLSYDTGSTTSVMVKDRVVFSLYDVGEFLVLKSRFHVVEIQIETEPCSRFSEGVCLCGVTFRNGNEIYTLTICRGVSREGFIYVGQNEDGKLDYEYSYNRFAVNYHNYFRNGWFALPGIQRGSYKFHDDTAINLLNGFSCIITRHYETRSLELVIQIRQTIERLEELDGIASFEDNRFRHRDGSFYPDTHGFIQSWRVPEGDSLHNPVNHADFGFRKTVYQCHCPLAIEIPKADIPVPTYINYNYKLYFDNVYRNPNAQDYVSNTILGVIKCSLKQPCQADTEGIVWPNSTVVSSVRITNVGIRKHQFHLECSFDSLPDRKHLVEWYAGASLLKRISFDDTSQVFIPAQAFKKSGDECDLDKEIRCAVTVYGLDGVKAGPTSFSEYILLLNNETRMILNPRTCVINHRCFTENSTNPNDSTYVCYPEIDPSIWIRNVTFPRVPGDYCSPSQSRCDLINGVPFCDPDTKRCTCAETHTASSKACFPIGCTAQDASNCSGIRLAECGANNVCGCVHNADMNVTVGQCEIKKIGSACISQLDCQHINNSFCDSNMTVKCVCDSPFKFSNGHCSPKDSRTTPVVITNTNGSSNTLGIAVGIPVALVVCVCGLLAGFVILKKRKMLNSAHKRHEDENYEKLRKTNVHENPVFFTNDYVTLGGYPGKQTTGTV